MPDNSNWLEDARKSMESRGTVGSFKSAAKRQGVPTMSFAKQTMKSSSASPSMKKKANFAINSQK
jgi:hypothetical protein